MPMRAQVELFVWFHFISFLLVIKHGRLYAVSHVLSIARQPKLLKYGVGKFYLDVTLKQKFATEIRKYDVLDLAGLLRLN